MAAMRGRYHRQTFVIIRTGAAMPYALAFPKHPDSRAAGRARRGELRAPRTARRRARSCPGRRRVARAYGVPLQ
ncbi:hypothetical protein WK05_18995 [Burkholderia ubonensis]|nr:hypothetical protein WK05_18995 [Burkholderia ubonensis]